MAVVRWRRFRHRWIPRFCFVYVSQSEVRVVFKSRSGYPYRAATWPFAAVDTEGQRCEIWERIEALKMKRIVKDKGSTGLTAADDPELLERWPNLAAFLTDKKFDQGDGGGEREPGSLSAWCSDGLFRAKLNDKDSGYCCYIAGATWDELWAAADHACSDSDAGWKPDPSARTGPKKK